nr:TetR/AcrR family transcriptional regulator [Trebonia sp.]
MVAAAAKLMFDGSVSGTTVEDVRAAAGVSSSQVYHCFKDKKALVQAVIEYQTETIVGGQEPMLAALDSLEGLRAWRDFLVEHQEPLDCRGGCPIGSLGSELAESDHQARAKVSAGFVRWEEGIRSGLLLLTQIERSTKPLQTALDAMLTLIAHEAAAAAAD